MLSAMSLDTCRMVLKEIVQPKINILSLYILPHVFPNLCDVYEVQKEIFTQNVQVALFRLVKMNGDH